MKRLPIAVFLVLSFTPAKAKEGADVASGYFARLRRERVESSPIVEWRNIGPGLSGYNEEFWPHPTDPDVLFMGPDMHVSCGTWDEGANWVKIFDAPLVLQVESSPRNPDLLVLNTGSQMRTDPLFMNPGVFLSRDGSRTWQKINKGLGNHDKIIDAKPDPHHEDIVWAAGWGSGWSIGKIRPAGNKEE